MGLDVEFLLSHQLKRYIITSIIEHKNQITEATSRKVAMEEWRQLNLQNTTVSLVK